MDYPRVVLDETGTTAEVLPDGSVYVFQSSQSNVRFTPKEWVKLSSFVAREKARRKREDGLD